MSNQISNNDGAQSGASLPPRICSAPTPWPYDYGQTMAATLNGFKPRYVSECCGASTGAEGEMETGICPHCREHCEFVDERGFGNE